LEHAIAAGRDAIHATADANPNRVTYLCFLANALFTRYDDFGQRVDMDNGIELCREAAVIKTARASARLLAAVLWAESAASCHDRSPAALEAYTTAMELLPLIVRRDVHRADNEDT